MYQVLLLDDEPMALKACKYALAWSEFGMNVLFEETDARAALEKVTRQHIDIAFVDLRMPSMDGFEFLELLSEISPNSTSVILTGYQEYDYIRKAFKAKVFDYCVKPIHSRENRILLPDLEAAVSQKRIEFDRQAVAAAEEELQTFLARRLANSETYYLLKAVLEQLPSEKSSESSSSYQRTQVISNFPGVHLQLSAKEFCFFIPAEQIDFQVLNLRAGHLSRQLNAGMVLLDKPLSINMISVIWSAWLRFDLNGHEFFLESPENLLNLHDERIDRILMYIHEHYSEPISLGEISDYFHINYAYLSELFSRHVEVTFTAYLNSLRLNEAARLLLHTDSSIISISAQVGYNSEQYFSRLFREHFGTTPSQFRKERTDARKK